MILLDAKPLHRLLQPLIEQMTYVPSLVHAVLHDNIEGSVWVNDNLNPTTAVIGTKSGLFAVLGNAADHHVYAWLNSLYTYRYRDSNKRFSVFVSSPEWERVLTDMMGDNGERHRRASYVLRHKLDSFPPAYVEAGFGLKRITPETIQESLMFKAAYYEEYWGSVTRFLRKGFGYVITYEERIVCECTAIFLGHPYVEVDIATHPEFRGLGLGRIAAAAFIQHSWRQGLMPRWECNIDNKSSMRLAEKLSFSHANAYTVITKVSN
ncbi:GNAT family N-acetyltransferase [Paenibacillus sp. ACRRX]|uniref:GNAT family N-acetyltransferase n=1 Tax=Paenibacillus sp. ACRRX TaxID=2918206 RepID=UPI001EF5F529|nr:GNAT family N-acetyltransferase [Paenibacillus sp. ACRRX]MCG7409944.1 GNAT family N-acetyltransferase [Paenibacillus sp. ACRRX]